MQYYFPQLDMTISVPAKSGPSRPSPPVLFSMMTRFGSDSFGKGRKSRMADMARWQRAPRCPKAFCFRA